MNGDADLPHRSSSPLKRRASSMDPEGDATKNADVDMGTPSQPPESASSAPGHFPRAMSIDLPENETNGSATTNTTAQAPPPLMEQVKVIETLLKAAAETTLKEGDTAYVVSRSWVDKALAMRSDPKQAKTAPESLEPLGPIDNSDIIEETIRDPSGEEFVRLKPGSGLESFELFPRDAWDLVTSWYGIAEGQGPIVRKAINTAPDAESEPNIMYEFHPPAFRIHRLWSEVSPLPIEQALKADNPPPITVVRSTKYHAMTFLKEIKQYTGIPIERKIRLFTVPRQLPAGGNTEPSSALTPPDSPGRVQDSNNPQDSWSKLLLDVSAFSEVGDIKVRVPLEDRTAQENYNGKASLQLFALVTDQTLILDESIDNLFVSTYSSQAARNASKGIPTRSNVTAPSSKADSGRSSPFSGPMTRGRVQRKKPGRSLGAVGLHNLGNTCYMNSALQCVRSVEELTKYFLTDAYANEINKTNPLGYYGKVALAYGSLLKEIYHEGRGSVSPREFKSTVGKCRSTFSGYGQQDSQEFLGFLLDGLQEDLSRIKKKPYIEKPDSTDDMIDNPEAIKEMADKVWDITRRRDDSVIADLFTGMYKSTLKCPECGKISITFDPFNNLTLPLPVEDMMSKAVRFYPLNDAPVKIEVELSKHSAMEALKQFISDRTGVPVNRLMGAEEFKSSFFKIYDNNQDVSEEIGSGDIPAIHELEAVPTNWPNKGQRKKYRSMLDVDTPLDATEWDEPRYDTIVVPVFHRRPGAFESSAEGTSPPHFITVTREEARDYDTIKHKVLEKVATFSTWSKLRETTEPESTSDADMVVTTASDADSSGDSKVATHSVAGEDDMVDITMKDANEGQTGQPNAPNQQSKILRRFNTRRPKFMGPDKFLDPELQGLFELSYFANANDAGTVPTGWSSFSNNKTLPKLSDRMPKAPAEDEDEASPESWANTASGNTSATASGNEDSSNEESPSTESGPTRMADESSEEEDIPARFAAARAGPRQNSGPGGKKKFKGHKTYGKKGNKRRDRQMRANRDAQRMPIVKPQPQPEPVVPSAPDGGPLIRIGEGLVVDWNTDAWETVFGRNTRDGDDSFQGTKTFDDMETLHDPALKISQRRRHQRRSNGITLDECLDEFERAEILSEQDMWYCPRCKEHRRASKKFDLWKSPDYLVAHLKRFSSSGYRRDKLDIQVDFPIEGLDLTSRVIQKEEGRDEIYDLVAVDDHYGGLGGGHYTAYGKNYVDGRWYNYNDSSVSPVSDPTSMITSAAYLLFYRRRHNGPLGGQRFAEIVAKYEASEEEEEEESGEDQRLGGGSSLIGSSSAGTGAEAVRPHLDRGLTRTMVTQLEGSDDETLPSYEGATGGEKIRNSIEDEGIEMSDATQPRASRSSFDMTQGWSFNALENGNFNNAEAGYGSDDAQADSSGDERGGGSQGYYDADTDMTAATGDHDYTEPDAPPAADDNAQTALSDIQSATWERKDVIAVPAAGGSDRDSDEVAEIHLEDKAARAD